MLPLGHVSAGKPVHTAQALKCAHLPCRTVLVSGDVCVVWGVRRGVRGWVYMGVYTGWYCSAHAFTLFLLFSALFGSFVFSRVFLQCFTVFYAFPLVLPLFLFLTSPVLTLLFNGYRLRIALRPCTSFLKKMKKTEPARKVHARVK